MWWGHDEEARCLTRMASHRRSAQIYSRRITYKTIHTIQYRELKTHHRKNQYQRTKKHTNTHRWPSAANLKCVSFQHPLRMLTCVCVHARSLIEFYLKVIRVWRTVTLHTHTHTIAYAWFAWTISPTWMYLYLAMDGGVFLFICACVYLFSLAIIHTLCVLNVVLSKCVTWSTLYTSYLFCSVSFTCVCMWFCARVYAYKCMSLVARSSDRLFGYTCSTSSIVVVVERRARWNHCARFEFGVFVYLCMCVYASVWYVAGVAKNTAP